MINVYRLLHNLFNLDITHFFTLKGQCSNGSRSRLVVISQVVILHIFIYASVYCIHKWHGEPRALLEGQGSIRMDGIALILGCI